MAHDQVKVGEQKSEVVRNLPLAAADEDAALNMLEELRWAEGACCPKCGSVNVYKVMDRKTGAREKHRRWRCRDCPGTGLYSVRTGTVMEESRIPLKHWCWAFWQLCSSKKGMSAKQIQRQTGLSYKSALFLLHRVRFAMADMQGVKLSGTVECDETYVGGKPRNRKPNRGLRGKSNYQTKKDRKTPVFAAVERNGQARVRVVPNVTAETLRAAVREHVELSAHVMTDELPAYKHLGREFAAHSAIQHKNYIYVRGDVTTNTVEGFFSLLKRGVMGVYHSVSREHLQRYLDEFEFRYNNRNVDDGERTVRAIRGAEGKRLTYRELPEGSAAA